MDNNKKFLVLNHAGEYTSTNSFQISELTSGAEYLILHILSGSISIGTTYGLFKLSDSELLYLPCDAITSIPPNQKLHMNILCFSGLPAELCFREIADNPHIKIKAHSGINTKTGQIIYLYSSILPNDTLLALNRLWDLLGELAITSKRLNLEDGMPTHVLALQNLFNEKPNESYSLNSLAKITHTNKFKLAKDFKAYFHVPPMQYLLEIRLKLAKELLISTELSVAKIAEKTGFSSSNYFVHAFKNKTGLSPTDYRSKSKQ